MIPAASSPKIQIAMTRAIFKLEKAAGLAASFV